ncbi:MAG: TIGR01440 family protein [Lachnospiraceae bacterium]|nr:TIGR01440 family protein [Lachnospiraceae bacterium]
MRENRACQEDSMKTEMTMIGEEAYRAAKEILDVAQLVPHQIFVVGCSTSEVSGAGIGTFSSPEMAEVVFGGIYQATQEAGVYLAAQCCEHLNRALIVEKELAAMYGLETVNVVPQPKAGGSFATAAYKAFEQPVAVEHIKAHAGMDIGDTLIGMHLRDVAVPVRIRTDRIGDAHVVCARTRAKFIGGNRAVYDETLE